MPQSVLESFSSVGIGRSIEIGEDGLVLGAGTCLARMATHQRLDLDRDRERVLALLSVVCGRPVAADVLGPIAAAAAHWQRGDKALANLRLVFSTLPRLDDPGDADRLCLAEYCLDQGMSPSQLTAELGLDPVLSTFVKYDPAQPRVPAGNGRESGRWGPGGGGSSAFVAPVSPSFFEDATPEILSALARFATRFSAPSSSRPPIAAA